MWAIIEGTDFAGKSTLVEAIKTVCEARDFTHVETLHRGRPDPETREKVLDDYVDSIAKSVPLHLTNEVALISDRWHFGELVYAPLKRPHTNTDGYGLLQKSGWRYVELWLLARGACVYWLQPPIAELLARVGRGDDYVKFDELQDLLDLYTKAMSESATYVVQYTHEDDVAETASRIVNDAMDMAEHAERLAAWPEYIGPPQPAVLVLTSFDLRPHGTEHDAAHAAQLLDALPDSIWQRVGLVNAVKASDSLDGLWEALRQPPVVALGEEAAVAAHMTLPVDEMHVLQDIHWVEAFHPDQLEEYGEAVTAPVVGEEPGEPWRV